MSDTRNSIKKFVLEKINSRDEKIASITNLNEQRFVTVDYDLFFEGAISALTVAGVNPDDFKTLVLASNSNKTLMKSIEDKIELFDMLNSEETAVVKDTGIQPE